VGQWLSKFQIPETAGEGTDKTDRRKFVPNEEPRIAQMSATPWEAEEVAKLRSHLAELRTRIDKGFETLCVRESAGKTGRPYTLWLETWRKLLKEYEDTADKLSSLTGCPIGDCHKMGECTAKPAACPAVATGGHNAV